MTEPRTEMPDGTRPPSGSHRGFIIATGLTGVASLLIIILWGSAGNDEQQLSPLELPSVPVAEAAAFEVPPPPPPPEESDAGTEPSPVGDPLRRPTALSAACSGECRGGDTSELRSALAGRARQAQGCYERELRQNPSLMGQLMVRVRVGPKGEVCSAAVVSDSLGSPNVVSCVLQKFRSASFPVPVSGCADLQVPINFLPKP